MNKGGIFSILIIIVAVSCSGPAKISKSEEKENITNLLSICEEAESFKALFINKSQANLTLGGKTYDGKISLYYIPDTIFFFNGINSGFEVFRGMITKDSLIIIDKINKQVYLRKLRNKKELITFNDLEYLFNRELVCKMMNGRAGEEINTIIDRSEKDIKKIITYGKKEMNILKFEFFDKKTGSYIVGEKTGSNKILVYSNYIIGDLKIEAEKGNVKIDEKINYNLKYNRKKYRVQNF